MSVRPSGSPSVRLSVRPSVRPGLRPPVFHTFLHHALTYWAEILHMTLFYCTTDQVRVSSTTVKFCASYAPFVTYNTGNTQFSALYSYIHALTYWAQIMHKTLFYCTTDQVWVLSIFVNFCGSHVPFGTYNTGNTQFSALFSNMLWHIELKFCIWLWFTVLQIKFECRHFASIFVGVMPLLELTILEIHSFPHFSLTCFDILSSNFAHDYVILYHRSSSSFVNFRQVSCELCPFYNLQYWKYTVFRTFLLHALTYSAEILHMILLYCTTDQVSVLSICVNFCGSYAPFWNLEYWKYRVSRTFLLHALTYWAQILHMTLFYWNTDKVQVSSFCVNFCGSNAPFGT